MTAARRSSCRSRTRATGRSRSAATITSSRRIAHWCSIAAPRTGCGSTFPPEPPCGSSLERRRRSRWWPIAGARVIRGGNALASGPGDRRQGPRRPSLRSLTWRHRIERQHYADIFGPTTGDRIRLGDTSLVAEVERTPRRTATSASSAAARCFATAWARPPACPMPTRSTASSPTRSSSTGPASARPTSGSRTAGSPASARREIPT